MFNSVVWPKGRPPSDKPQCGFNNELCEWMTNGDGRISSLLEHKLIFPEEQVCIFAF